MTGTKKVSSILLKLSIPNDASKIGKVFLEFCVDEFGGKSKLFNKEELTEKQAEDLAIKLLKVVNKRKEKGSHRYTDYTKILYRKDLGPLCTNYRFTGLHFEFISDKKINKEKDYMLGEKFLRKVYQLFQLVNHSEQVSDHWKAVNDNIMREPKEINTSSNAYYYAVYGDK